MEDQTTRRRALAFAGVWLLLCGLLTALSLIVVVLGLNGLLLLGCLAVMARRAVGRVEVPSVRVEIPRVSVDVAPARARAVKAGAGLGTAARGAGRATGSAARGAARRSRKLTTQAVASGKGLLERRAADPRRQAHRFNARGTELRRRGDYQAAAEQHFAALEIARAAGDLRTEAMTLNNLALALAKSGADSAAVHHFELAREALRRLGDAEYEAKVIANLGMVHRHQGRSDEATTLLNEALTKLPPESPAYHRVEAVLRRAS